MNNYTITALKKILSNNYDHKNPILSFQDLATTRMLASFKKNDVILHQMEPVTYFYFLLKGKLSVINSISWSTENTIDTLIPLDILGLTEYLNNIPHYTASVVAETPCILFRIPVGEFISLIKTDAELCYATLCLLGQITSHNMGRAETRSIFHPQDRLGHFLFLESRDHLPYVCPLTRKELSKTLNINLRTLYRYLSIMEEQHYLKIEQGKIIIEQEHLQNLNSRYGSVIL